MQLYEPPAIDVQATLASVDWDFSSAPASSDLHSIHPYPAKFIAQIPRKLIELFYPEGSSGAVFDPFCGSGTTLVEAVKMGLDAVGIDLNPLACLIATVKTTPFPAHVEQAAFRVIKEARTAIQLQSVRVPDIPRLDHWFLPEVQVALAALTFGISREEDRAVRNALEVALSSIIVNVSNQESDTRYAAVEKNIDYLAVLQRFERAAKNCIVALSSMQDDMFSRLGKARIINQDILAVTPHQIPFPISLVITSPPYPNAYEYWLYHKYRMYWLGMDPIAVRSNEIGARPHYFKGNQQTEVDFERQMRTTFKLLYRVMMPGSMACFIVGRSVIHGRIINNVELLQRAAADYFVVGGIVSRSIRKTRKSFNLVHGKINTEHIVVFVRSGE